MSILIYLAPVFVPMVLFEVTKGYYDSWLKLVTSYALQPMIIAIYIAMMMTIYDQTMFGNCKFTKSYSSVTLGGYTRDDVPIFKICDPNNDSACTTSASVCDPSDTDCTQDSNITACADSIGYIINPTDGKSFTKDISAIFFTITILNSNVVSDMLNGLVTLCLFGYLFYKFADLLSDLTGELTGGPPIGAAAGNPMALVEKAGNAAVSAAKAAASGGSGGGSGASASAEGGKARSGAESSSQGGSSSSGASSSAEGGKKPEGEQK